jgi:hypothetical protein
VNYREKRGLLSLEKAQGLGPCLVGVRVFESRPPHIFTAYDNYFLFPLRLPVSEKPYRRYPPLVPLAVAVHEVRVRDCSTGHVFTFRVDDLWV